MEEQSDLDTRRPGDYTITYTVTYRGRTAHATRTVTVRDTTAPVIELRGDAHSFAYLGADWKDKGVTATDDVDGDVTSSVTVSGTVDTSAAGDYTITYTVTDQTGNTATAERTVTVKKADQVQPHLPDVRRWPQPARHTAHSRHTQAVRRESDVLHPQLC